MGCGASVNGWGTAGFDDPANKYRPCAHLRSTLPEDVVEQLRETWELEMLQRSTPAKIADACQVVLTEQGFWKGPFAHPRTLLATSVQNIPYAFHDFDHLVKLCSHAGGTKEQQAQLLFALMDKDGSGELDKDELAHLLVIASDRRGEGGMPAGMLERFKQMSEDIIALCDVSGDGVVDVDEFLTTLDAIRPSLAFVRIPHSKAEWEIFRTEQALLISEARARIAAAKALAEEQEALARARGEPVSLIIVNPEDSSETPLLLDPDATLEDLRYEVQRITSVPVMYQSLTVSEDMGGILLTKRFVKLTDQGVSSGSRVVVTRQAPLYFNVKRCHPLLVLSGSDESRPDVATDLQPPGQQSTIPQRVKVYGGVMCTAAFATGTHNWFIEVLNTGDGSFFFGCCVPWANVHTTLIGINAIGSCEGWGLSGGGLLYKHGGGGNQVRPRLRRGEKFELELDCDRQTLTIRCEGRPIPGCELIEIPVSEKGVCPFVSFNSSRGAELRIEGTMEGAVGDGQKKKRLPRPVKFGTGHRAPPISAFTKAAAKPSASRATFAMAADDAASAGTEHTVPTAVLQQPAAASFGKKSRSRKGKGLAAGPAAAPPQVDVDF